MDQSEITLHGHRISFRTAGSGPLLVLIHGIAGNSSTWEEVAWGMRQRYTIVAPDLIGHGDSSKPHGDYSLGSYANMLRDLLGALGFERGTLVGHSLGGGIAMQFAYQFPDRCERLVLVSSGGLGREVHPLLRSAILPGAGVVLPWLCGEGTRSVVTQATRWLGRLGLRAGSDLEGVWQGFASLGDAGARRAFLATVRSILDAGGQRVSATDRLYLAEEVPTLIVWGERDPLIPVRHAHAAHQQIPGSRLEVFPNAGHFPYRDDMRRFVEVLLDFCATTRPAELSEALLRERLLAGGAGSKASRQAREPASPSGHAKDMSAAGLSG